MVYRVLDPVQDASLYLADTEMIGEPKTVYPICDWCEEEITESNEWCYEIAGEIFCEECMRSQFGLKVRHLIKYE